MRERVALSSIVLALFVGCGSGPEPRGPSPEPARPDGPGEVPARAAVRLDGPCIERPETSAPLVAFATDKQVRFCVLRDDTSGAGGPPTRDCWTVDLATGALTPGGVVPTYDESTPPYAATVAEDGQGVAICPTGLADPKCETQKLELGPNDHVVDAEVNDANTRLAYALEPLDGNGSPAIIVEPIAAHRAGKPLARFGFGDASYRCPTLQWVGSLLYVSASVCAGPGAAGELFDAAGKKLADVGGPPDADGGRFGTWGHRALALDGGTWGFLEADGKAIAIHDGKTGALVRRIDLAAAIGADVAFDNPGEAGWARTPGGKLVVVGSAPALGVTVVVDPATGAAKQVAPARGCPQLPSE